MRSTFIERQFACSKKVSKNHELLKQVTTHTLIKKKQHYILP